MKYYRRGHSSSQRAERNVYDLAGIKESAYWTSHRNFSLSVIQNCNWSGSNLLAAGTSWFPGPIFYLHVMGAHCFDIKVQPFSEVLGKTNLLLSTARPICRRFFRVHEMVDEVSMCKIRYT